VECVRQPDRIEANLYVELVANPSKALLFCCTVCWHKGCIVKQLYKLQSELAVVSEQWLASTHTVDEARDLIKCLQADKAHLQAEVDKLYGLLHKIVLSCEPKTEQITARVGKAKFSRSATSQMSAEVSDQSEDSGDTSSGEEEVVPSKFNYPKGFKEQRFRVDKFSGNSKEVDFEVWFEDFLEATNDCGWNDADKAKWFSWFLTGPTKYT